MMDWNWGTIGNSLSGISMMKHSGYCRQRLAFTAIELVVVIFVVFMLLGLVLVVLKIQRQREKIAVSPGNNLKQLIFANHSCNDIYRRLPPAFDKFGKITFPAS